MGRNQILAITFCSLACLGFANTSANAGWFGPSDYNECMLETMKSEPQYMSEIASTNCLYRFACNAKFSAELGKCITDYPELGSQYCARQALHYCTDP
jgi:hypothetical protein